MILYACDPGQHLEPAGIFLVDDQWERPAVRVKKELDAKNEDIILVWSGLAAHLVKPSMRADDELLSWLESAASHAFQFSERRSIEVTDLSLALDRLYSDHVGPLSKSLTIQQ